MAMLLYPKLSSFADELMKISEVVTPLLPHQQRVVERISQPNQPGLLVVHGLGSGKTLTSIAAQEALGTPSTVVVPAALQANYEKERKKHLKGSKQKAKIQSLQGIARSGQIAESPLLIVDEAHRAREPGSKTLGALKGSEAEKKLLLTGTPFYNHPSDIAPLLNLVAEKSVPATREDFSRRYITEQQVSPSLMGRIFRGETGGAYEAINPYTKRELGNLFQKYVDYHPGSTENFPTVEREQIRVPMTSSQRDVYDALINKAPPWVAAKVRAGLPPSKQEAKQLNAFLTAARQVANTTRPYAPDAPAQEPKIDAAFKSLQKHLKDDPEAKAVIYSNFLDAGVSPYKERLTGAGIPYGEFTGELSKAKRDALVNAYNEGKVRALLLSSAGGEGLDLKNTRLIQLLEPHWNKEKLKQVEGRGIRYKSHESLPAEKRKVRVEQYLSTVPEQGFMESMGWRKPGYSVDEYLDMLSSKKEQLNAQFRDLMANRQEQLNAQMDTRPSGTSSGKKP